MGASLVCPFFAFTPSLPPYSQVRQRGQPVGAAAGAVRVDAGGRDGAVGGAASRGSVNGGNKGCAPIRRTHSFLGRQHNQVVRSPWAGGEGGSPRLADAAAPPSGEGGPRRPSIMCAPWGVQFQRARHPGGRHQRQHHPVWRARAPTSRAPRPALASMRSTSSHRAPAASRSSVGALQNLPKKCGASRQPILTATA